MGREAQEGEWLDRVADYVERKKRTIGVCECLGLEGDVD